jgi:hypothetical protein
LPFTLATGPSSQALSWSSPPSDMTPCSPPWHVLLTLVYLWTNHLCISHKHILVHLGCHSITKTKQRTFHHPIPPPSRTHIHVDEKERCQEGALEHIGKVQSTNQGVRLLIGKHTDRALEIL